MKVKSIKAITLSMPFSHGGKKVIFHGKEWKSLEFNLVKIETCLLYTSPSPRDDR